jgi:hypothetical protein
MATMVPAHDADKSCVSAKTGLRGLTSFAARFLTVSAAFCAMALAGCARNSAQGEFNPVQHEVRAAPVRASARAHQYSEAPRSELPRYAELRVHRPDPELLAPQAAPDCEFRRADNGTVDPNEWVRLKIDYERQCYQDAEKIARDRLRQLQASSTCEIEPAQRRRPDR